MQRYGSVIGIHPEMIAEYKRLHTAVWPEVLEIIKTCNISNYSIFLREPENLIFSYFEYHGGGFAKDIGVGFEDCVGGLALVQILPDILDAVEFRRLGRQRDAGEIGWHLEPQASAIAGPVEQMPMNWLCWIMPSWATRRGLVWLRHFRFAPTPWRWAKEGNEDWALARSRAGFAPAQDRDQLPASRKNRRRVCFARFQRTYSAHTSFGIRDCPK